uniref:Uncharacterized protein n=1 Tax=Solanum lycopersicum TaxID=4081 RepID=A0A3Q7G2I8_SOLLC
MTQISPSHRTRTCKTEKRQYTAGSIIRWNDFKSQLQDMLHHSDTKGVELKKPSSSLYTFPMPDCMCKHADVKSASGNRRRLV